MKNIKAPCLLIDKTRAVNNIRKMKQKADKSYTIFRPHFKTHQSAQTGEWFRAEGIDQITVSSIDMAYYFVENGWKDITIAFPLNIRELEDLVKLAKRIKLNVLISSITQIEALSQMDTKPLGFFIKIDTGYHRSGLEIEQLDEILQIINYQNKILIFKGILAHFGHTYYAQGQEEIAAIYYSGIEYLLNIKKEINRADLLISIGDTPSCSLIESFNNVNEIRPGNFVYYDLMQKELGACTENQIAAVVACPVIDIYPKRNEILIYGGAVHLSKEYIVDNQGNKSFGAIVNLHETGWSESVSGTFVKSLSQEHGIISCAEDFITRLKIGSLIGVIPVHSCLAADLLDDCLIINS